MLKRVLVVVLAKRVAPPRPSKSTKMASPSSMLAHASNASLASTIAPPAPSPKANNSGFIETLNPSAAPQDVALFFVRRLCARFTARIRRRLRLCARFTARIRLRISAISPLGSVRLFGAGYFAAWLNTPALPCYVLVSLRTYARLCASRLLVPNRYT